jgi:hypothetical protein
MAVIASDAHISGMRRSDHRGRSGTTREGSCDIVDISYTSLRGAILAQRRLGVIRVGPDRDSVQSARGTPPRTEKVGLRVVPPTVRGVRIAVLRGAIDNLQVADLVITERDHLIPLALPMGSRPPG